MADNKVTYGLEKAHIALSDGAGGWEAPQALPGAVRLTAAPQGTRTTFYADNMVYFTTENNRGYTGELEMADIPLSILEDIFGWTIDTNGMLVEIANAKANHFALMGQIEGDIKARRFVYYDCEPGRPTIEYRTKGEEIEIQTAALPITMRPMLIGDKWCVKGIIEPNETNQVIYDGFFSDVLVPAFGGGA